MGLSSGNSDTLTLGTLGPTTLPPIADAGGGLFHDVHAATRASPITFDGSAAPVFAASRRLRWDFSDGGVAFGKNPQHTFQGSGRYSGLLTATDATGLDLHQTFSVRSPTSPRAVAAGPDTSAAWGRTVDFNGAATDPGRGRPAHPDVRPGSSATDRPAPRAAPSTTHVYAAPGCVHRHPHRCAIAAACATPTPGSIRCASVMSRLGSLGDTAATYDTRARATRITRRRIRQRRQWPDGHVHGGRCRGRLGVTNVERSRSVAWTPALAPAPTRRAPPSRATRCTRGDPGSRRSVSIARRRPARVHRRDLRGTEQDRHAECRPQGRDRHAARRPDDGVRGRQPDASSAPRTPPASPPPSLKLSQKNGTYQLTATVDAGRHRRRSLHRERRVGDVQAPGEVGRSTAPRDRGLAAPSVRSGGTPRATSSLGARDRGAGRPPRRRTHHGGHRCHPARWHEPVHRHHEPRRRDDRRPGSQRAAQRQRECRPGLQHPRYRARLRARRLRQHQHRHHRRRRGLRRQRDRRARWLDPRLRGPGLAGSQRHGDREGHRRQGGCGRVRRHRGPRRPRAQLRGSRSRSSPRTRMRMRTPPGTSSPCFARPSPMGPDPPASGSASSRP